MKIELHHGDCLEVMRGMPDNSVDAIVTDPPYGLGFMGKEWDHGVPSVAIWCEALRVLKHGGHLLAFAGTRTQHRMATAIEDAGFEIRDMIAWVYGSGFPKSLDVSKAIDKAAGAEREILGPNPSTAGRKECKGRFGGTEGAYQTETRERVSNITAPATEAARQWQGWGTALKPALEPITVARKPLAEPTVAANVLAHGTGGLNVDGCRVGDNAGWSYPNGRGGSGWGGRESLENNMTEPMAATSGRWPANLIHDGQAAADLLGNAARFFYSAKASKRDRSANNNHPTVKPTDLMRYLVRLVTPPTGVVLDPFMGSGSTGKAARLEGYGFIGIELNPDYLAIARERINSTMVGLCL